MFKHLGVEGMKSINDVNKALKQSSSIVRSYYNPTEKLSGMYRRYKRSRIVLFEQLIHIYNDNEQFELRPIVEKIINKMSKSILIEDIIRNNDEDIYEEFLNELKNNFIIQGRRQRELYNEFYNVFYKNLDIMSIAVKDFITHENNSNIIRYLNNNLNNELYVKISIHLTILKKF